MPWMFSFLNTDNKACTVNLHKDDIKMENAEIQGKLDNFTDLQPFLYFWNLDTKRERTLKYLLR